MNTKFLFPHSWKRPGWIILIPSAILGFLTIFFNVEFDFLQCKVFTIYSQKQLFNDSGVFLGFIENNLTQTIEGVLFLVGGMLVAFSKEEQEDEFIFKTRVESLVWATYINYAILIFCFIFFYEFEFLYVMVLNMFTILIFFIVRFYYMLHISKKLFLDETPLTALQDSKENK